MPKDHYVAKTYLNQFTGEDGKLTPYYKKATKTVGKRKHPTEVCKASDGDTNQYFKDPRAMDGYLTRIENSWHSIIQSIENRNFNADDKYLVSAYIAYLRNYTLAAKRIIAKRARRQLATNYLKAKPSILKSLEEKNDIDQKTKDRLKSRIESGAVKPKVKDDKYTHALATQSMVPSANRFYCSQWKFLYNTTSEPFITSDNPVCLLNFQKEKNFVLYLPLSPRVALAFKPNNTIENFTVEIMDSWKHDDDETGNPTVSFVSLVNELLVRSAEKTVFHSKEENWITELVEGNSNWRVELTEVPVLIGGKHVLVEKQIAACQKTAD